MIPASSAPELMPGVMLDGLDEPHVILSVTEREGYALAHSPTKWATGVLLAASTTRDTHHRFVVWNTYYRPGEGWHLERGDYVDGSIDDAISVYADRGGDPASRRRLVDRSILA